MAAERRNPPTADPELTQAFHEIAKGESTATAMESQLTALERKIDHLLASVDVQDPTPAPGLKDAKGKEEEGGEEALVEVGDGEGLIRAGKEEG